jgi:hypothetical protein
LAPCHFSNAGFVEMVNEVVFDNRAAIIHYDPNIENAQNYETFYGKNIGVDSDADETVNLYYVDDAITSGGTFFTVNSFIQRINSRRKLKFDACIFFINRTGFYENENIKRVLGLGKLYSFANLHLPYVKTINVRCPLCDEFVKYEKLQENSYLTKIKLHFQKEENKMKETDIYAEFDGDEEGKTCRRIEAIHRMYDLFSKKLTDEYLKILNEKLSGSYSDWVGFLLENTNCPFIDGYLKKDDDCKKEGNLLTETQITVIKSLTQSPFYNYKIIRESTFRWTLELLEKKIEQMYDMISKKEEITKNSLNELKLLIRRATLLNSNCIISYKLIYLLKALYVHGIQGMSDKEGQASDDLLRDFTIFFTAQVNELLYQDEARSKELNNRLYHFEKMLENEPVDSNSQLFRQLVRMLLEENAANIRTFAELFEREYEKYRKRNEDIETIYKTLGKHNQYKALLKNVDEYKMKRFLKVRLSMRDAVKSLKRESSEKSQEGVPAIKAKFNDFAQFIDAQEERGCFAIVKYKTDNNPYFMLYNKGKGKEHIESHEADYLNQEKFLIKFLKDGECDYSKSISIIEFHKSVDGHWQDLFSNKKIDSLKEVPLPTDINRLLLLRIDNDKLGKRNGQAVIGFYFKANDERMTDVQQVRFLLLLRDRKSVV